MLGAWSRAQGRHTATLRPLVRTAIVLRALTNSEICCHVYFHPEPEAWVAVAGSESAEMKSRGKYALTSDAEGFILVLAARRT